MLHTRTNALLTNFSSVCTASPWIRPAFANVFTKRVDRSGCKLCLALWSCQNTRCLSAACNFERLCNVGRKNSGARLQNAAKPRQTCCLVERSNNSTDATSVCVSASILASNIDISCCATVTNCRPSRCMPRRWCSPTFPACSVNTSTLIAHGESADTT